MAGVEGRTVATSMGDVTFRERGRGPALVLLHGIGSGSGSWDGQLSSLCEVRRVVAWDAPGYGGTFALPEPAPAPADYAEALAAFLDVLGIGACDLVGHSLGALMACAFARRRPERVNGLVLASPAAGYGGAPPALREERRSARLALLYDLGPEGLARERHGALLAPDASDRARERVRAEMARIRPGGYRQAVEALAQGDICADAREIRKRTSVIVGSADRVTPRDACRKVADCFPQASFSVIHGLGHACYVEDPDAFNAALERCLGLNADRAACAVPGPPPS